MSQITYDMIEPLIASSNESGSSMQVVFRCPVAGQTVEARGHLQATKTMGGRAADSAKRSVVYSLRTALSRSIRRAFGYGIAGQVVSDVARGSTSSSASQASYSDSDRKQAMVRAFESVSNQFVWDSANNRYIGAQSAGQVMTDFMQQLETASVTAPYDQGVLARMLTEIACADGTVADEERMFLASFIPAQVGTVDSLAKMQRLSPAELAETVQGTSRETMYMLTWAVALTDEELAPQEEARIAEFATGLGVAPERAAELRRFAQVYLVDHSLGRAYPGGQRDQETHDEVMAMAQRIGLDATEAERVDIRFRKRYGLV
jgi:tellurite resistance protein